MVASIQQTLVNAEGLLAESDSPRLDAELLLSHCLGKPREYLFTYPQIAVADNMLQQFKSLLMRRQLGEPLAYLIGKRQFWDIELAVNSQVLIPRPETELLVESALELLPAKQPMAVADLGTGSGAIALALAHSRPHWRLTAVDLSVEALAVAQENARLLEINNVEFRQSSWCDDLPDLGFDMVLANPPYVAPGDTHLEQGDLRFEPLMALQARDSGFADLFSIADQARRCLKPGGWLLLEHGIDQHEGLKARLAELGYTAVCGKQDLSGHQRMMQGRWVDAVDQES